MIESVQTDPKVNAMMDQLNVSRRAFHDAEAIFWELRVTNEELRERIRVLTAENERLKEVQESLV